MEFRTGSGRRRRKFGRGQFVFPPSGQDFRREECSCCVEDRLRRGVRFVFEENCFSRGRRESRGVLEKDNPVGESGEVIFVKESSRWRVASQTAESTRQIVLPAHLDCPTGALEEMRRRRRRKWERLRQRLRLRLLLRLRLRRG